MHWGTRSNVASSNIENLCLDKIAGRSVDVLHLRAEVESIYLLRKERIRAPREEENEEVPRARYLDSILSLLRYYRIILKRGSLANCRSPLSFSFLPLSHHTIPPLPLGHAEHA